jgi:hypothetical protein
MNNIEFKETQQFKAKWAYLLCVLLSCFIAFLIYGCLQQFIEGKPFGDKPAPDWVLAAAIILLVSIFILIYFAKLETLINEDGVSYKWSPIHKKYKQITGEQTGKAEIINDGFAGFGWHCTKYGQVNNTAGSTGLQLVLKSGKKIVIGTQESTELLNFITQSGISHNSNIGGDFTDRRKTQQLLSLHIFLYEAWRQAHKYHQ